MWYVHKYPLVQDKFKIIRLSELEQDLLELNQSFSNLVSRYNLMINNLLALRRKADSFSKQAVIDEFELALSKIKQSYEKLSILGLVLSG